MVAPNTTATFGGKSEYIERAGTLQNKNRLVGVGFVMDINQ